MFFKRISAPVLLAIFSFALISHTTWAQTDRAAIEGKFKSAHNVSDKLAELQAKTFLTLLALADLNAAPSITLKKPPVDPPPVTIKDDTAIRVSGLHYNIQIHLPPTKDIEVFNAIFKSLKEHLLAK